MLWTTVNPDSVKLFTSTNKDSLPQKNAPCIIITTYAMACHGGKRSESSELMMDAIRKREWGLIILVRMYLFIALTMLTRPDLHQSCLAHPGRRTRCMWPLQRCSAKC